MPGDVRIASAEDVSNTHSAKSDVVVAFLALGSIGDCLPLCAIAASYRLTSVHSRESRSSPSRCRPSFDQQQTGGHTHTERRQSQSQQQQQQQSKAEVIGADGVARKDDRNFKRRREEGGTVEKTRPLPSSSPAAAAAGTASSVAIVTHRCHCDLLRALMEDTFDVDQPPPRLYPVDLPVLFETTTTTSTTNPSNSVRASAATGQHEQQQQEPGIKEGRTCEGSAQQEPQQEHRTKERHAHNSGWTAGTKEPAAAAASGCEEHGDGGAFKEMDACMSVLEGLRPKALVFNLYSAFGYHLADVLRIPCMCVSPGVVPSDGGGVPLRRVLPRSMLQKIDERMDAGDTHGNDIAGDEITRADLELWMLPLFVPRYRRWRESRGLLPGFARSSFSTSCRQPSPSLSALLPRAPPILFGVSPAVLPRPGYWPAKAEVCGFWSFPGLSQRYRPPERLARFLTRCEVERRPVFVVGLGSMPALGLVEDPGRIVSMAVSSLLRAGAAVVLLPTPSDDSGPLRPPAAPQDDVSGDASRDSVLSLAGKAADVGPLPQAAAAAAPAAATEGERFVDLTGEPSFVPHQWLLPRCRGIVHHGGSGTTGAALSAGCVQVVIPLAFDQFFFADQVEYMGVGVRVPGTRPPTKRRSPSPPPPPPPPPRLASPGLPPSPAATASGAETNGGGGWVTAEGIENAIRRVMSPSEGLRAAARRYRDLLREEREENDGGSGGVGVACAKIAAMLGSESIRKAGERD